MTPKPIIVGFGELLWDLLPSGAQLGGAPGNFAYHAHVLGSETYIVSSVGCDELGDRAINRLRNIGLSTRFVVRSSKMPTGSVEVTLNSDGQASYTIIEHVAWDAIPQSTELLALAARADAVCFGSLAQRSPTSRDTLHSFLRATRSDCLRVFDINLRSPHFTKRIVLESLMFATFLKLNDEELPQLAVMLGCGPDEASVSRHLFEHYSLQLIVLTRGARGATLISREERIDLSGKEPIQVIDTVGAGDSFTAAFVSALLRGMDLSESGTLAIRHASYVCTQAGAMPEMSGFLAQHTR